MKRKMKLAHHHLQRLDLVPVKTVKLDFSVMNSSCNSDVAKVIPNAHLCLFTSVHFNNSH